MGTEVLGTEVLEVRLVLKVLEARLALGALEAHLVLEALEAHLALEVLEARLALESHLVIPSFSANRIREHLIICPLGSQPCLM